MEDQTKDAEIAGYNRKHKRIRGSLELKYPPRESRCRRDCGTRHYSIVVRGKEELRAHPCFLAIGHEGACEFSSECDAQFSHVQVVTSAAA